MSRKNTASSPKFWTKSFSSSEVQKSPPISNGNFDTNSNVSLLSSPKNTLTGKRQPRYMDDSNGGSANANDSSGYFSDVPTQSHRYEDSRAARSKSVSAKMHHKKLNYYSSDDIHNIDDHSVHSLSSKFKTLFKPSADTHSPASRDKGKSNNAKESKVPSGKKAPKTLPTREEQPLDIRAVGSSEKATMSTVVESDKEEEFTNAKKRNINKNELDRKASPTPKTLKQVGHLILYTSGEHEHKLKKAKLLEKQSSNLIPGAALLSGLLKPKGAGAGNGPAGAADEHHKKNDNATSIFAEIPEFKLLQELKARRAGSTAAIQPAFRKTKRSPENRRRLSNFDDYDEDDEYSSEPEVLEPAIDRPQLELINKLVEAIDKTKVIKGGAGKELKLSTEYGTAQGVCGRGSYGVVKFVSKVDPKTKQEKFYAVKELKQKSSEDPAHFSKRLISEFVISLSLNHVNIVKTYDLMRNSKGVYSEVLEYCDAGDLYTLVAETNGDGLHYIEADCLFKQLLNGIIFMHSKGIAHCDLKPENVLLTRNGTCKIIDFGTSAVFKTAFEDEIHFSRGACGSEPYVAPEEYVLQSYDPRLSDVWALGVIYMVMRIGTYLWQKAKKGHDDLYEKYLSKRPFEDEKGRFVRGTFEPIESLKDGNDAHIVRSKKETIYDILEPDPEERIRTLEIYDTEWISSIVGCRRSNDLET